MTDILKRNFGYDTFRPMQEDIIRHVIGGGDALVLMPTGGGKSLCYQIPALAMEGTAIVISPLISLMKDQVDALKANGIPAVAMNSSNDSFDNQHIVESCLRGEVKLLYESPERFVADLQWMQHGLKVSLIAIDEAHCISQWGHDFRPVYTQLENLHQQFPGVPIMALTATADKITKADIIKQLHLKDYREFVSSFDRPNLSLAVRSEYSAQEKFRAIQDIIRRHRGESGIIYCLSRKNTETLAAKLKAAGYSVAAYHAGMQPAERTRIQEDFKNDRIDIICATIAFGMGIDKSNIRFVVHYNLPKSIESFYQEIGRAGRDSLPSETVLFYNLQDVVMLRKFADESGQREINYEKLQRMQEYAEARVCRRRILLNYFGETTDCHCGNCDVCKSPPELFDGTVIVQKALSAIKRTDENIGRNTLIDILEGTYSPDVTHHGYQQLKTFGAGRDVKPRLWRNYLLQMLQMGYIEIAYNEDMHLKVTSLGSDVLFGRAKAELVVVSELDFAPRKKAKTKKEREKKAAPVLPLQVEGAEDGELFQKLRGLRLEIAEANKWPPYIVLSDKSLHALAKEKPVTIADFGKAYGIGEYKQQKYGAAFVALIRAHLAQH